MDTQRITISLPEYLYKKIIDSVPPRKVSSFIASIVEEKIICGDNRCDPIEDFLNLRKELPKMTFKAIKKAIEKGRV